MKEQENRSTSVIPFRISLEPDRIIRGDWHPAKGPSHGSIVLLHGYKGFKDWGMFPYVAARLAEAGYDVAAINFSHNGVGEELTEFTELEKFAKNTFSLEQEDLHAVVQAIHGKSLVNSQNGLHPSEHPIYLLGHSKGGGGALLYALEHEREVDGIISWNGITHPDLLSEREKEELRANGRTYMLNGRTKQQMPLDLVILDDLERNRERYDLLQRASDLRVPMVIIQGEEDGAHLRRGSARLVERQPEVRWHLIPEGNHTFGAVHPFQGITKPLQEAIRLTLLWLEEQQGYE